MGVPWAHGVASCPSHCSFSCGTACPDHCCNLPTVSTLPICPAECHTRCHELCPMHCCKVSSFSVSRCPSHCKTSCDPLCPSYCCSQQLTPTVTPMQPTCNPVCQTHCVPTCPRFCCKFKFVLPSTCPDHSKEICDSSCPRTLLCISTRFLHGTGTIKAS